MALPPPPLPLSLIFFSLPLSLHLIFILSFHVYVAINRACQVTTSLSSFFTLIFTIHHCYGAPPPPPSLSLSLMFFSLPLRLHLIFILSFHVYVAINRACQVTHFTFFFFYSNFHNPSLLWRSPPPPLSLSLMFFSLPLRLHLTFILSFHVYVAINRTCLMITSLSDFFVSL